MGCDQVLAALHGLVIGLPLLCSACEKRFAPVKSVCI